MRMVLANVLEERAMSDRRVQPAIGRQVVAVVLAVALFGAAAPMAAADQPSPLIVTGGDSRCCG